MRSKAGAINGQQASLGGRSLRWNVEMQIPPKTTLQWGAAQPSLWGQVRGRSWLIPTDPDGFKVIGWFGRICSNWTYSGKEQDERLLWEGSTGGREARVGDPINSGSHCFSLTRPWRHTLPAQMAPRSPRYSFLTTVPIHLLVFWTLVHFDFDLDHIACHTIMSCLHCSSHWAILFFALPFSSGLLNFGPFWHCSVHRAILFPYKPPGLFSVGPFWCIC